MTEPDDIVKIEDEMRRQETERIEDEMRRKEARKTRELPGSFRWFQDDDEKFMDNTTNLTYGTWVWCKNDTCVPHPPSRGPHPPSRGSVAQAAPHAPTLFFCTSLSGLKLASPPDRATPSLLASCMPLRVASTPCMCER